MHEFHAWIGLSSDPYEDEIARTDTAVVDLRHLIDELPWGDSATDLRAVNGTYFFTATGNPNRRRSEGESLDTLVAFVPDRLPGWKVRSCLSSSPSATGVWTPLPPRFRASTRSATRSRPVQGAARHPLR